MSNCLVTQLKGSVDNDSLLVFNQLSLWVVNRAQSAAARIEVSNVTTGKEFSFVVGSGATSGSDVGPTEVSMLTSRNVYGTGRCGLKNPHELKTLYLNAFVIKNNIFEVLSKASGLTSLVFKVPASGISQLDLSGVSPLASLVSLETSTVLSQGNITVDELARLYPNVETLTLNENGITTPAYFSKFLHLSALNLQNISTMSKVIERAVKAYIADGVRTTGSFTFVKSGMSDTFNGKTLSSNVTYTVTWTASQINVTDGDQFNETMTL